MTVNKKTFWQIGLGIFALYLAIHYWDAFIALLGKFVGVCAPLIIGAVIAYAVNIVMSIFESGYFPKSNKKIVLKTRRPVCIALAFIAIILVMGAILFLVAPQLWECIQLIIDILPAQIDKVLDAVHGWGVLPENIFNFFENMDWKTLIDKFADTLTVGISNMFTFLVGALTSVFSTIVTALLSIIFSIYLLAGKNKLGMQSRRVFRHYIKPQAFKKLHHVVDVLNISFKKFIIGQCTEAVILGVLTTLGMLIFGFPYATMIGALIGFTALIPIVGAFIGAGVGAFMILTVSPLKAVLFIVFIVILQQLEGNIIYPRVVGSSIGLPGIWVLAAVTVGGGLFGILGMLLGVPIAASVYRFIKEDVKKDNVSKADISENAKSDTV